MSKFNTATAKARGGQTVITAGDQVMVNHQGGTGVARGNAKSELFLMAVSDFGGEDTFYEKGNERVDRMAALAREVAQADPDWTRQFVTWLRAGANMRSASLIIGVEAAAAGAGRYVANAAMQRADEPGEALAYWHARHGRALPAAVKRGIADAARRLYREGALAKYDSARAGYRFADVIELTHPKPVAPWQSALFKYAIDSRHRATELPPELAVLRKRAAWLAKDKAAKRAEVLGDFDQYGLGLTWETVGSEIGLDADTWTALIPSMGYMALLRNLRNFEEAGVPDEVLSRVAARIADPAQVAMSRQLPLRFLSAYRNTASLRFKYPLEQALNYSLGNVPALKGRTLILIDRSGSMFGTMSARSSVTMADTAALFGTALALRAEHADLVVYGSGSQAVNLPRGASVLPLIDTYPHMGGTDTYDAMSRHYRDHDRVVLLTDEQHGGFGSIYNWGKDPLDVVPANRMAYVWNLAGYKPATGEQRPNRVWMGGLTDQGFQTIPLIEAGRNARWPWEDDS